MKRPAIDNASTPRSGPSADPPTRRQEVIREAAGLFDQRGYHSTSMEDIADAVNLRKPSLYHYFNSKDEILFWIHEEFIDLLIARHERRMQAPMLAEQLVLEVMADVLELMETHHGHVRVFFEHHRELAEEKHAIIVEKRERYAAMVNEIIQKGIDEKEFRAVDVKLTTLALFGICNWAYQWYHPEGSLRTREIAYTFWDMFMHGIRADESVS